LATHLRLALKSRIPGAKPSLTHTSSWYGT